LQLDSGTMGISFLVEAFVFIIKRCLSPLSGFHEDLLCQSKFLML
jgi:hypothetical protein